MMRLFSGICFLSISYGLIHQLRIQNDDRNIFKIETFGFYEGGKIFINITDFGVSKTGYKDSEYTIKDGSNDTINNNLSNSNSTTSKLSRIGFIMRKALSESAAQEDLEKIIEKRQCIFDQINTDDVTIDLSNKKSWKKYKFSHVITSNGVGLYSLIFARCAPSGPHVVHFKLDAVFFNPGPDYLSAGDEPLPLVYFVFTGLFSLAFVLWSYILIRDKNMVNNIHVMMLILLAVKCMTLLFEGVRYHYIAIIGSSEMWNVIYYIFAFLKGIMLFTVILLIGSGWSLMKSYLNDKEKRIILVVLILQVLDNIAMIVLEETAPGSQGWLQWRDVLHLVDILCCCAVLLPIVWSIRHLKQASEVDGKAHNSLVKLQNFRQFYVMVVVYIYFTRIVVFLLSATISFQYLWLGPVSTETATLIFFVVTGYKFRPTPDNPYFLVRTEDDEASEYGLPEGHDINK